MGHINAVLIDANLLKNYHDFANRLLSPACANVFGASGMSSLGSVYFQVVFPIISEQINNVSSCICSFVNDTIKHGVCSCNQNTPITADQSVLL